MKVKIWIQMGCERREGTFEVSDAARLEVGEDGLEMYIEDAVLDWIRCQYRSGWSCDLMTNDCSIMEDDESPTPAVSNEVLNPHTQELQYHLDLAEGDQHGGAKEGNALSGGILGPQRNPRRCE